MNELNKNIQTVDNDRNDLYKSAIKNVNLNQIYKTETSQNVKIYKTEKVSYLSFHRNERISAEVSFSLREYIETHLKWNVSMRSDQPNKSERTWQDEIDDANIVVCVITKSYDEFLIDELLYIKLSDKPVVYVMLHKLTEIEHIGVILVNKKFVKAYKEPDNFKKRKGKMFLEFENLIKDTINLKSSNQLKQTINSIPFDGNNHNKFVENVIERLKKLAGDYNLYYYFSDWLNKEKENSKIRIAVVGERKRGKSALINAILRMNIVESDPKIPTKETISLDYETHHVEKLKDIVLIDTPGVGSIFKDHDKILINYLKDNTIDSVIALQSHTSTPSIEEEMIFKHELLEKKLKYVVLSRYDFFKSDLNQQEQDEYITYLQNFFSVDYIHKVDSKYTFEDDNAFKKSGIPELISALSKDYAQKKISSIKENFNLKINGLLSFLKSNLKNLTTYFQKELKMLEEKKQLIVKAYEALDKIVDTKELDKIKTELKNNVSNKMDEKELNEKFRGAKEKLMKLELNFNKQLEVLNKAISDAINDISLFIRTIYAIEESTKTLRGKANYVFASIPGFVGVGALGIAVVAAIPITWPIALGAGTGILLSGTFSWRIYKNESKAIESLNLEIDDYFKTVAKAFNDKKSQANTKYRETVDNFNKILTETNEKLNNNEMEFKELECKIEEFRSSMILFI